MAAWAAILPAILSAVSSMQGGQGGQGGGQGGGGAAETQIDPAALMRHAWGVPPNELRTPQMSGQFMFVPKWKEPTAVQRGIIQAIAGGTNFLQGMRGAGGMPSTIQGQPGGGGIRTGPLPSAHDTMGNWGGTLGGGGGSLSGWGGGFFR